MAEADVVKIINQKKQSLIELLINAGCIKFGEFVLKSGLTSPYYINLREITMSLEITDLILDLLSNELPIKDSYSKTAIVGIPYGVVPIAFGLARDCRIPYYPVRKEIKTYGDKTEDSCSYDDFQYILVEDVMSTGSSIVETITKLESKHITDVIVIVDRELGGKERLAREYPHIKLHTILNIETILATKNEIVR